MEKTLFIKNIVNLRLKSVKEDYVKASKKIEEDILSNAVYIETAFIQGHFIRLLEKVLGGISKVESLELSEEIFINNLKEFRNNLNLDLINAHFICRSTSAILSIATMYEHQAKGAVIDLLDALIDKPNI